MYYELRKNYCTTRINDSLKSTLCEHDNIGCQQTIFMPLILYHHQVNSLVAIVNIRARTRKCVSKHLRYLNAQDHKDK